MFNKETITNPIELKKFLDVKIQVVENGTNTNPIDIVTQKDENLVEVGLSSYISTNSGKSRYLYQ